jgi:hypothetical protein
MKTVIYTCNIGNYRDEFKNYYSDIKFDPNIDYFLYTDKIPNKFERTQLQNWTMINIDIRNSEGNMDDNRWTTKYLKFILPDELKNYDIIIWIDSKMFTNIHIQHLTYEKIIAYINNNNNHNIFNLKHSLRSTIQQELSTTIEHKIENREKGIIFYKHIAKHTSRFILPDTCIIIRKNNTEANQALEYCLELLKTHGLKRDQNVYNYALDKKNVLPKIFDSLAVFN